MRIFQQVTPDVPRRGRHQLGGAQVPHEHIVDRITWANATSIGESVSRTAISGRATTKMPLARFESAEADQSLW